MHLAAKLLAKVEVSESSSHQHEFNAGLLRVALELPKEKTSGKLDITYVHLGDEEPTGESCTYTMYDSREGKPRAAEYRLYFDSRDLQGNSRPGDILIVVRPDDGLDLRALILPQESETGRVIASMLRAEGIEIDNRFAEIVTVIRKADLGALLSTTTERVDVPDADSFITIADRALIDLAIATGSLPPTKAMADEAGRIVRTLRQGDLTPDDQLQWSLEAETALFQHIEQRLGQKEMDHLAAAGRVSFSDATTLVLKRLQSRKSRRGQSLQNHFRSILEAHRIPYGAQCRTERDERPDFLIPGCSQYSNQAFPDGALRMVACKSIVRERWRQILEEADRIPDKYLLTVDPDLTDDTVAKMLGTRLSVFLPERLLRAHYEGRTIEPDLGNVARLVDLLGQTRS
jgi:hypothetical protein